jgi:ribonuclease D
MKKLLVNKYEKTALASLKRVVFNGRIEVIYTVTQAERAVDFLLSQPLLGFDTETRPAFSKGQHYKCSLLQVSTPNICFLFRLNSIGMCPAIVRLLSDRQVTKVGLAWNNDLLGLHQLGDFEAGSFVDLQGLVKEIGIEDQSLVKIYANLFGERISKAERLSNWERDILKDSQKLYAAIDAWACVKIYEEVMRLKETGDYELRIVEPEVNNEHDEKDISEKR